MTFTFGTIRASATILALITGAMNWPAWYLVPIVLLHAAGGYLHSRALFGEVQARLVSENADADARQHHEIYYRPVFLREFALAFVKCGIAYFVGFWLAQLAGAGPGGGGAAGSAGGVDAGGSGRRSPL